MLKLKLQYFGHLMQRVGSLEKTLMVVKIEGRRRKGWQRVKWLDGITDSMDIWVWVNSRSWWWRGRPGVLQSIRSQRVRHNRITELNWTELSKVYGFSSSHVYIWKLKYKESWVLKNWCFELWCWRRFLRVPWMARRSNHFILKEISPEYSLERLMLQLKLQYFGHLMRRADSFE